MLSTHPLTTAVSAGLPPALAAGQLVFQRFRLQKILGQGGMGVVWLARDVKLERDVALKFVADPHFRDVAARDELRRETRRTLELTHPNIVRTYDYVEDADSAAISLEYVNGDTLSQMRVQRANGAFDVEDLQEIVRGCAEALEYAHLEACIVHRDLKPSNIMVTSRGTAKIADFGISCGLQNTAARISAWNNSGGTLGYMSPQQLRGELASPADDVYGFGATLYELLTGRPPFYSGDLSYQIREIAVEPVDERRAKLGVEGRPIPRVWIETIAACLSKEPQQRPSSMRDVAERLGLNTPATSTRSTFDPERTVRYGAPPPFAKPKPARSRRSFATNLWFVFAVLAVVATLSVIYSSRNSPASSASRPSSSAPVVGSPSAAAGQTGGLLIKSTPPGATIFVADEQKAKTPKSISELASGAHAVRLELEGFEPFNSTVNIKPGEYTDLGTIALQRSTGSVLVETDPQGVPFSLLSADGATVIRLGQTPEKIPSLPTGGYLVQFERAGWPSEKREVQVRRESTEVVENRFGIGTVEFATDPPGAIVRLGGNLLGLTPRREELPSGRHGPFTVKLEGYKTVEFELSVVAGEAIRHPIITLEPEPPSVALITDPPGLNFKLYAGGTEPGQSEPIIEGTTPEHLLDVPAGTYRVVFDHSPWPSVSRGVVVSPRGTTLVEQVYETGKITVTSQPPGAAVLLAGAEVGKTPFETMLPVGKYEISAEYKGRMARTRSVELGDEDSETIRFDFTTGNGSSTATRSKSRRKPIPKESYLTKVGRSISNLFTADKKKKR